MIEIKHSVGDEIWVKAIIKQISIEEDNKPKYAVDVKGCGTYAVYGLQIGDEVIKND